MTEEEEKRMAKPGNQQNKMQPRATKTTREARAKQSTRRPVVDTALSTTTSQRRAFTGFDRERATYERLKADLLVSDLGKYVVIVGEEVLGPLESHEEAERTGYKRFGLGPLYVKQVVAEEPVFEVSRLHQT
jgi:hypothetical protein